MADRINSAMAYVYFERLAKALGKEIAPNKHSGKPGSWALDTHHGYGGHVIIEHLAGGGDTSPMMRNRLDSRSFVEACDMALYALAIAKQGKTE